MSTAVLFHVAPAAMERGTAAAYCGLSETTFSKEVQEGRAPRPRKLSDRRVCWLRAELDAWLISRPVSDLAPPPNTGARKPRPGAAINPAAPASPSAAQAVCGQRLDTRSKGGAAFNALGDGEKAWQAFQAVRSAMNVQALRPDPDGAGLALAHALELLAPHVPAASWPAAPAVEPGAVDLFDRLTGRA